MLLQFNCLADLLESLMPLSISNFLSLFKSIDTVKAQMQHKSALLMCSAINHLLTTEPTIHEPLKQQTGRILFIRWESGIQLPLPQPSWATLPVPNLPAGEQYLRLNDDALFEPISKIDAAGLLDITSRIKADVTVTIKAGITSAPIDQRLRWLHIEGDVSLANSLFNVIKHLRWDITHDIANVIGDIPAYWLSYILDFCKSTVIEGRYKEK
ncbi:MAG: hypothetical protein RI956_703 [Pseudomonadota bacterium]|jgi:hypothetical protein